MYIEDRASVDGSLKAKIFEWDGDPFGFLVSLEKKIIFHCRGLSFGGCNPAGYNF